MADLLVAGTEFVGSNDGSAAYLTALFVSCTDAAVTTDRNWTAFATEASSQDTSAVTDSPNVFVEDTSPFTAAIMEANEPWLNYDYSRDLYGYLLSLGKMLDTVMSLVIDQGFQGDENFIAGWGVLLDPDFCPTEFLPYLGSFVGVPIPPGTDDATARAQINAECSEWRGSPGSIVWATQQWLTGTKTVALQERTAADGSFDAYHFVLVVRPSEVVDVTGLTNAVNVRKPAGIQWTLVQADGWLWNQAVNQWQADHMTWDQTGTGDPGYKP